MESYAGYRGTSPPNLFVSFNRDELDMDSGIFTSYKDPLDLKNTFLSWEFGFDGGNKGMGKLVLINPAANIEDKLFSWYAALSPRSWVAEERDWDKEELEAAAAEVADFYVRWGYQSHPTLATTQTPDIEDITAMSHMHKFRLMDMSYQISDKGDKIITLHLINLWELFYTSLPFVERERQFEFELVNEHGVLRQPSLIIQEVLLQLLAAHEEYMGYSKWTDDQFEVINADFEALLKSKLNTSTLPSFRLPVNAESLWEDYVKQKSWDGTVKPINFIILNTIQEFFGQFGMVPSYVAKFPDPVGGAEAEAGGTSPNQGTGAPDNGNSAGDINSNALGSAEERAAVAASEFTEKILIIDPTRTDNNPIAMAMSLPVPGSPIAMGLPPYTLVFKDKFGIAKTELTTAQMNMVLGTKYFFYAVHPVFEDLVTDKEWDKAFPYLAWSTAFPPPMTSTLMESDAGVNAYDIPHRDDGLYVVGADMVVTSIQMARDAIEARRLALIDEINTAEALEAEQEAYQETMALLSQTGQVGNIDEEQAPPPQSHVLQFMSQNLVLDLDALLAVLNDKYFKGTSRYLQTGQMEFANVPKGSRAEVEEAMPEPFANGLDWDTDAGTLVLTDTNHMNEIFSYANLAGSIKSFPIQSDVKPTVVSLATGFNNRKDNIITSLNWRINSGSMFLSLRNQPMIVQKLYNVAKRFEGTAAYRDVVMGTLSLNLHMESAKEGFLTNTGNGAGGIAVSGVENQEDIVGSEVFPDAVVESALAQAVTMTSTESGSQDSADTSEASRTALVKQVQEDLKFITDNSLTDIFFPKVDADAQASIRARYTVVTPAGEENSYTQRSIPYFRYVTKSPINILQKKLESQGLTSTLDNAVLVQAKVQSLNIFQKLITDINIDILGVPEMDIWTNEIQNRSIALWVHEPRVPGTFHWLTGMYTIADFVHRIDANGYKTSLRLVPKLPNTGEEMRKYTYLGGGTLS